MKLRQNTCTLRDVLLYITIFCTLTVAERTSTMFARKLLPVFKKIPSRIPPKTPIHGCELASNRFTFLTYNMLSPHYMWPQVYTYVKDEYKDWNYRHELLEHELFHTFKADIMCLQELTANDYDAFWKSEMEQRINYGSKFAPKSPPSYWEKATGEMDGVGVFYNMDKFESISSTWLALNNLEGIFDKKELEYLSGHNISLTNGAGSVVGQDNLYNILSGRNQVSLFVSLRHIPSNSIIIVINTHLYWKYDEVKLVQCLIIMRKLQRIIKDLLIGVEGITFSKVKILFSGDFNSTRDSLVIKFLNGQIVKHGDINLQNPMKAYLSHSIYDDIPDETYVHTCYSGKLKGIFDYIWFHPGDFEVKKVLSGIEVSRELQDRNEFGLPNEVHPSDHIPVFAELELI